MSRAVMLPAYAVVVSMEGVVVVVDEGVAVVVGHGSWQELMAGKLGPE